MLDPELKKFLANLRPAEMATCESCGREHVTLYRHLSIRDKKQCIACWKEKRDEVPPPPEPVRRIVVAQETFEQLERRVLALETQLKIVIGDVLELRQKRTRR